MWKNKNQNHKIKRGFRSWYWAQFTGRWYQRIITPICTFFLLVFLFLGAVDINFLWLFGDSPSLEMLQNPKYAEASVIYSNDSVVIGKFYTENRSAAKYNEISPYVIQALISTEDERFYQHNGVDYSGILGALKDALSNKPRGASTITQQLAKNLYKMRTENTDGLLCKVPVVKTLIMKAKEWNTAFKIENIYNKQDIVTLYLNTVDFGSNAYGIKTAAKRYFNTTPKDLTIEQSATLVGLLKATTGYNPIINEQKSLERRNVVIDNMYRHKFISKEEAEGAKAMPMAVAQTSETEYGGQAQYFRDAVRRELGEWCAFNNINLNTDGLKIYTTIDTRMQQYAEEAVLKQMKSMQAQFDKSWGNQMPWHKKDGKEDKDWIEREAKKTLKFQQLMSTYNNADSALYHMYNDKHMVKVFSYTGENRRIEKEMTSMDSLRYMKKKLHCGFVVIEPQTSHVKAWVGDVDYVSWNHDKVTAPRQPGSTFKLFDYITAFEKVGLSPNSVRADSDKGLGYYDTNHHWTPYPLKCDGNNYTLRKAFAKSKNAVAVRVGLDAGVSNVIAMAKKLGVVHSELPQKPAVLLGAGDVCLIDMVNAYATVINDGMRKKPVLITRIVDKEGNVVYDCERDVDPFNRVVSYRSAFYMQTLLQEGVRSGTSTSLPRIIGSSSNLCGLGGKTGTTQKGADFWFIGCTPKLVGGAWVGGEYQNIRFRGTSGWQGANVALPVFGFFMQKVLTDKNMKKYRVQFNKNPKYHIDPSTYRSDYEPRQSNERNRSEKNDSVKQSERPTKPESNLSQDTERHVENGNDEQESQNNIDD